MQLSGGRGGAERIPRPGCCDLCIKNFLLLQKSDLVKEARQTVGIWSTVGVGEVRQRFWEAWEHGKEHAKRWTMMDAFMMMMPTGDR